MFLSIFDPATPQHLCLNASFDFFQEQIIAVEVRRDILCTCLEHIEKCKGCVSSFNLNFLTGLTCLYSCWANSHCNAISCRSPETMPRKWSQASLQNSRNGLFVLDPSIYQAY
ncbi:hypothetical protein M758_3G072100 [Ceratodon purpureus]|nr:hypothetical protein M758_3G072100 [Ceratodon purpureus]